jgi:hypothetical protein
MADASILILERGTMNIPAFSAIVGFVWPELQFRLVFPAQACVARTFLGCHCFPGRRSILAEGCEGGSGGTSSGFASGVRAYALMAVAVDSAFISSD